MGRPSGAFRLPQFDYLRNVIFTDSAVAFGGRNLSEQLIGLCTDGYEAEPGHARQMASFLTAWRRRIPPTAEPGPGRQMRAGHFVRDWQAASFFGRTPAVRNLDHEQDACGCFRVD